MTALFPGPSGAFENRLQLALFALGFQQTPVSLFASFIINIMVLMTTTPRFKLKPLATWYILSLRAEIMALCALYKVKNVEFQFDCPLDAPAQLLDDFFALGISGAMLSKNPINWKRSNFTVSDTELLLNFFALIRTMMDNHGPEQMTEIIADYDNLLPVPLPPNHLRHTGVGPRIVNPYRGFDTTTPLLVPNLSSHPTRTHAKPSLRFNPFASRSRPVVAQRTRRVQLDLDGETSLMLLPDAPLRMQRRRAFGLGGF